MNDRKLIRQLKRLGTNKNFNEVLDEVLHDKKPRIIPSTKSVRSQEKKLTGAMIRIRKVVQSLDIREDNVESINEPFLLERIEKEDMEPRQTNLSSSIKSIVLSDFMMTMTKTIDDDLTQTLDFNSLVRLSMKCGGKTITVPEFSKVENLLAASYYAYLVIVEHYDKDQAVEKVWEELKIRVSKRTARQDLSNLALVFSEEVRRDNSSISQLLQGLLETITELQGKLKDGLGDIKDVGQLLAVYNDVNQSFLTLTTMLGKLGL